jgi:hypothetical protein
MTKPTISLDADLTDRIQRLADARHRSPDSLIGEAIEQYLSREESQPTGGDEPRHPSGKPWPQRTPVGGIITPV